MKNLKDLLLRTCSVMAIASLIALIIAPVAGSSQDAQAAGGYVSSLTLSDKNVTLIEDEVEKAVVTATVKVSGGAKQTVTARSSDTDVATVKVGKAKSGVTKITVTAEDSGSCVITVKTKGKNSSGKPGTGIGGSENFILTADSYGNTLGDMNYGF